MIEDAENPSVLDDGWKIWIWHNVERGCQKDHIFKLLHERGFSYTAIRDELGHDPSVPLDEIRVPMVTQPTGPERTATAAIRQRELAPFLREIPDLLSGRDCELLIDAARDRLIPSTVVTDERERGERGEGLSDHRTSSNVTLELDHDSSPELLQIVSYLRGVVASLTGLPEIHQENFQVVYYGVNQKFELHRDDFPVGSEYMLWESQRGGQRLFSFMVYLNDVEEGGVTQFPQVGIQTIPELGKGLVWANVSDLGWPYAGTMHGSLPVTRGEKWVLVCWIREGPFGQPLTRESISDRRGIEGWLEPPVSIQAPGWITDASEEQRRQIPFLRAGNDDCHGFEKRRVEDELYEEILAVYRSVQQESRVEVADAVGSFLCTVRSELPTSLYFEVTELNELVHRILQPLHEEWCGFKLTPSACYGFRTYLPGSFLHMHVDRPLSHVISSTICVDANVYSPWLFQAVDAQGQPHGIDIEPGELLLYESAHVSHGRPVPLNGRYYAALFVHYQPAEDHDLWVRSPRDWSNKHRPRRR